MTTAADVESLRACEVCGRVLGEVGKRVECAVCHRTKKPWGRDAPMSMANGMCDHECPGYAAEPHVGELWQGESRRSFGYNLPPDDDARCYARDEPGDHWRLGYERLRAELASARADNERLRAEVAAWKPLVDAAVAWVGASREECATAAAALSRAVDSYLRGLLDAQRKRNTATPGGSDAR